MTEIWKDYINYEGQYQISSLGRVKSLARLNSGNHWLPERILKPGVMTIGYKFVSLCKNGKTQNHMIHRMVAILFISNPENKRTVNHIDENKTNNCVENLEWNTSLENNLHNNHHLRCGKSNRKAVTNGIKTYDGIIVASKELGIDQSSITKCCLGKVKTCGGYTWSYI